MNIEPSDLMTVPEAANFLRLQPSTVRSWILKRRIKFIKLGSRAVRFLLGRSRSVD